MSTKPNELGEGNYETSRTYNEATKKFVESGRVEAAAQAAAPRNEAEARELLDAERAGREHATTPQPPVQEPLPPKPKVDDPAPKAPAQKPPIVDDPVGS
ncbi:MAG: hypothetical protein ABIO63_03800 [Casimicrobiaceae bacterium]